jgi:phage repressor protein C with HTH and peptisase S24 domain
MTRRLEGTFINGKRYSDGAHKSLFEKWGNNQSSRKPAGGFSIKKSLPVLERAQGGDDGSIVVEENPVDWTNRPADLQGVHGAFAVFVTGNSMAPKYRDGEIAYIHLYLQPQRERYVLVETHERRGFI